MNDDDINDLPEPGRINQTVNFVMPEEPIPSSVRTGYSSAVNQEVQINVPSDAVKMRVNVYSLANVDIPQTAFLSWYGSLNSASLTTNHPDGGGFVPVTNQRSTDWIKCEGRNQISLFSPHSKIGYCVEFYIPSRGR